MRLTFALLAVICGTGLAIQDTSRGRLRTHAAEAPPPAPAPEATADCEACAPGGCDKACQDIGKASGSCAFPGSTDAKECCKCVEKEDAPEATEAKATETPATEAPATEAPVTEAPATAADCVDVAKKSMETIFDLVVSEQTALDAEPDGSDCELDQDRLDKADSEVQAAQTELDVATKEFNRLTKELEAAKSRKDMAPKALEDAKKRLDNENLAVKKQKMDCICKVEADNKKMFAAANDTEKFEKRKKTVLLEKTVICSKTNDQATAKPEMCESLELTAEEKKKLTLVVKPLAEGIKCEKCDQGYREDGMCEKAYMDGDQIVADGMQFKTSWFKQVPKSLTRCFASWKDDATVGVRNQKCGDKGNGFVVIINANGKRFGGYHDMPMSGAAKSGWQNVSPPSRDWLFSSKNEGTKIPGRGTHGTNGWYGGYFATWGGGHDLYLPVNFMKSSMKSAYTNLCHGFGGQGAGGSKYPTPDAKYSQASCNAFMAGSYNQWNIEEVSIFIVEY